MRAKVEASLQLLHIRAGVHDLGSHIHGMVNTATDGRLQVHTTGNQGHVAVGDEVDVRMFYCVV